jgi:hypothetical protein
LSSPACFFRQEGIEYHLAASDTNENVLSFFETAAVMRLASCLPRLPALFLVFPLGLPLAASATIYKWTDEHGTTVYSNRAPAAEAKVSNVQVALEDERPAATPGPNSGNALQDRVRALEQQVQALQGQPPAQAPYPAPQPPPVSYYPPQDYYPPQSYPSYPADYYSSMYGYGYPYYPYYPSYIVVTGRRFVRPVHPVHHGFVGQRPMPVSHAMGATAMGGSRRR